MPNTLRAFVAIPIPETVAHFLGQIQARLRSAGIQIRLTATRNIHLTLRFLGEVDGSQIPSIADQMDAVAGSMTSFRLNAEGVGGFPTLRRARVLWVGLSGDRGRLQAMQTALESGLVSAGFGEANRRYHPHLTIGRSRRRIDAHRLTAALEMIETVASDSFRVDCMQLIESKLKPAGAQYTLLHTSPLGLY